MSEHIDIVFDGPPGPESCKFVEVEDDQGRSINFGDWVERDDGYWVLRVAGPIYRKQLNPCHCTVCADAPIAALRCECFHRCWRLVELGVAPGATE